MFLSRLAFSDQARDLHYRLVTTVSEKNVSNDMLLIER